MSGTRERDYVLGTHDAEIERLGLQHRLWRPRVLEGWDKAGIGAGSRVLDVGAGPGWATQDLAERVGPGGRVVAVERSARFLDHNRSACAARGLSNVTFLEKDLMLDPLEEEGLDAAWCRWVACFVGDPALLVKKIAVSLRVGGTVCFHEYVDYRSWKLSPPLAIFDAFVGHVIASWRESGGEPDIARVLPGMLHAAGFRVRATRVLGESPSPKDPFWQWPEAFVGIGADRLVDLKRVTRAWADELQQAVQRSKEDPATFFVTPLVMEIVAERVR